MADRIFTAQQAEKAESIQAVVGGTIEANDLFLATIGNKISSVAAGSTVAATAAATIEDHFDDQTEPEFLEGTFSVDTATITWTMNAAHKGKPSLIAFTTTESNGAAADAQTFTQSTVQAAEGPHICNATNFGGTLPVDTDTVYFQDSDVDLLYALEALSAVTLTLLVFSASYTGKVGLPKRNSDGDTDYYEHRPRKFKVGASTVRIGDGNGNGSPHLDLNFGSVQTAITVFKTSQVSDDPNYFPVRIIGTHANNALTVHSGFVDIARDASDASTFASISVSGNGYVRTGSKVTHTNILVGGEGTFDCTLLTGSITTCQIFDKGTAIIRGEQNVSGLNVRSGNCKWFGSGTIASPQVGDGGCFDARECPVNFTVTGTIVLQGAAKWLDPNRKGDYSAATWQSYAGIDSWDGSIKTPTIDLGPRVEFTVAAIT